MNKSFKFIFFDINNIITNEKEQIKEGDELKNEIKEKFVFINSIIDNFIDNHILVDVEKEEKFSVYQTSFIYQIENGIMQNFRFFLFRQIINDIFNIEVDAFFIVLNLEKNNNKELLEKLFSHIINNCKIKVYFLGIYESNNNIITTKENISDLFIDEEQPIDYKYKEININKEKDDINEKIDKFIEEAMLDVYTIEKENNFEGSSKGTIGKDRNDNNSVSGCLII